MKNELVREVFNLLYNDANLVRILASSNEIKQIENFYKNNYKKITNYNSLISLMETGLFNILKSSPAALSEFEKQFTRKKTLQPGILNECFILQTLANKLNLDSCQDMDITKPLQSKDKTPRYKYYSSSALNNGLLLQYGDPSSTDAVFIKGLDIINIEIKDSNSKLEELDLKYQENGKLSPSNYIKKNVPDYIKLLDEFNLKTNIFNEAGSNYTLKISDNDAKEIINKVSQKKRTNLYLLKHNDYIIPVPSDYLFDIVDISTSEIRPAGRNYCKVFTPKNLSMELHNQNAIFLNNIIKLKYNPLMEVKGRLTNTITRYSINSLYFVKYNDTNIQDTYVIFPLAAIKQKKPTISIHLKVKNEKEILRNIFNRLNQTRKD